MVSFSKYLKCLVRIDQQRAAALFFVLDCADQIELQRILSKSEYIDPISPYPRWRARQTDGDGDVLRIPYYLDSTSIWSPSGLSVDIGSPHKNLLAYRTDVSFAM